MVKSSVALVALLAAAAGARPAMRRDDPNMSSVFASMFAQGAYQALEHADASTNENLVIEKMLWTLNAVRYMHDAPPVTWNQTLQDYATKYASTCIAKHTFGPYGENLYIGGNDAGFALTGDIEEKAWNGQVVTTVDELMKSGHFFQLIWKATTQVGCGRVWCGPNSDNGAGGPINSWMWFCEFNHQSGVEGFAGNISARTADAVPAGWDVPENHVSFTSFPPITLPAMSFPASVSYLGSTVAISEAGMTLTNLPPAVIASETGVSGYGIVPTAAPATAVASSPPQSSAPAASGSATKGSASRSRASAAITPTSAQSVKQPLVTPLPKSGSSSANSPPSQQSAAPEMTEIEYVTVVDYVTTS